VGVAEVIDGFVGHEIEVLRPSGEAQPSRGRPIQRHAYDLA
jgi:hypothetical protein